MTDLLKWIFCMLTALFTSSVIFFIFGWISSDPFQLAIWTTFALFCIAKIFAHRIVSEARKAGSSKVIKLLCYFLWQIIPPMLLVLPFAISFLGDSDLYTVGLQGYAVLTIPFFLLTMLSMTVTLFDIQSNYVKLPRQLLTIAIAATYLSIHHYANHVTSEKVRTIAQQIQEQCQSNKKCPPSLSLSLRESGHRHRGWYQYSVEVFILGRVVKSHLSYHYPKGGDNIDEFTGHLSLGFDSGFTFSGGVDKELEYSNIN